jgi:hypothetical protein
MPVTIVLELSDDDLGYYRRVMDDVWKHNAKRAEKELVDGARRLLRQATKAKAPTYVQERLADLVVLLDLLDDSEWPLPEEDRRRIVAAVGYFAVAKDMIPDKILRGKTVKRADWLAAKRRQIFLRVKRRHEDRRRQALILRYAY